jgi:catalase
MQEIRTAWMAAALVATLPWALAPATARAQQDPAAVAEQTVEVMQKLFGQHPGQRVNHAKGVVVEGSFTPAAAGARLSRASLFRSGTVPVIARFSDATGVPDIADGSRQARPNGLAVRFQLPNNEQMDMVLNTLPFFPVATGEEFLELLRAAAASGPGTPKPTPIERFGETHPAAPRAAANLRTPASFARTAYNGINAFAFLDAAGKRQPFRIRVVPVEGEQTLGAEEAARQPPNFLMEDITSRLGQGRPVQYRVMAQLARPGDQTRDATQPWPEDRETVELGTLTFDRVPAEADRIARETVFMPNSLPDGIEPSDDPLIDARVAAYAVSFGIRSR